MRFMLLFLVAAAVAQRPGTNYDEAKVPQYTLPGVLVMSDGTRVRDAKTWETRRRPEILELYRHEVFGRTPTTEVKLEHDKVAVDDNALGGKAVRKQVTLRFPGKPDGPKMRLRMYLPAGAKKPV